MSLPSMEERTFDFCFIGNEHPIKGIDRLKKLAMETSLKLAIIGNIVPFVKKSNIVFFGELTGLDKKDVLLNSKFLLLTSYHESMSLVIIEALTCGTPVIAYDMPTLRSIYKKGVIFIPQWDILSKQAYKQSKEFDWEREGKKILCE